ncbi:DUF1194 domain-containing protein [Bradyrhizobium sp. UFLA05-109]
MRCCVSVGALFLAGAIIGGDAAGIVGPSPKPRFADTKQNVPSVNVELVIAVDISYSMDMDELAIQREGYARAIVSNEFLQALGAIPGSKVAVTYFEWSMSGDEKIIIPWRVIDGPESAAAVAAEIMETPVRRGSSTSISGAINFALQLFEENPFRGSRRVIDISGDGPNNDGAPVTDARDAALEKGIIINGLPIMVKQPSLSTIDIENLDLYYEDCVIGGPGAFIMTIKDRENFQEAIRIKLVLEVAGLTPESGIVPATAKEPRVPCLIGERKSQERGRR